MKTQFSQEIVPILKIVFVGHPNAGKTSLIRRQANNIYQANYRPTIGVDFNIKRYQVSGLNIKAQLWDGSNCGGLGSNILSKCYLRGSQATIICFDLNDYKSFTYVQSWFQQLKLYAETAQIFLVGCKSDLEHKVSKQEIIKFSFMHGIVYFQTSAKEGKRVSQFMQSVVGMVTPKKIEEMKNDKNGYVKIEQKNKKNKQGWIC